MSHSSEEGENYWPGYVDALTSMVQVLAFVMMMLAMAVFVLSQSVSKKAVEAIAKAVNAEVKPNADIKQLTQSIVEQVDRLRAQPSAGATQPEQAAAKSPLAGETAASPSAQRTTTTRITGGQAQPSQSALDEPPDAPRMTITFAERSFKIDGDQSQSLVKFVGDNQAVAAQAIIVHAYAYSGEGAISEARRLAYYRAMTARKQLVDAKVRPENIRISVNDTADKAKGLTTELIVTGSAR
jgi:3-polyprenyl-4-hydroxybenzoate decarboxylase